MTRRLSLTGAAALFLLSLTLTAVVNLWHSDAALAGGQVQSRKITLSDSNPGDSGVTYAVSFIPTSNSTVGGIVVDFCANDPIVGDTSCTYPTGFTMGSTPSVSGLTGIGTGGSWLATSSCQGGASAGNTQVLKYTNTTAQTPTYSGGTVPITFNITGVTNTGTNGSFYARIATFDTSADTANYTCSGTTRASSMTGLMDYGGVALSTTQNIIITSKVFETLSFCVYQTSCGTQAQLTMGDATTGLSSSNAYANIAAKYTLATNASSGVTVSMFGTTLCRVTSLTYGNCSTSGQPSNTISAIGATVQAVNSGTYGPGHEAFGMCVNPVSGTTAANAYKDTINNCTTGIATGIYSGTAKFGFDDTNTTGTNSSGGSTVLTSTGPVLSASSQFAFAANIAPVTEAGIYQANLNMVATGTF